MLHLLVIGETLATLRATLADFKAKLACTRMILGTHNHEISVQITDIAALDHKPRVRRLHVPASFFQTIKKRFKADLVRIQAILNALAELRHHA